MSGTWQALRHQLTFNTSTMILQADAPFLGSRDEAEEELGPGSVGAKPSRRSG